jgi:branched-chain amino acid transport system substrate-binding protein
VLFRSFAAAAFGAALAATSGTGALAQEKQEYKVGVMGGLSGLGAQIGKWVLAGAQAAADNLAASGGPKFTLIAEDTQWAPQKGVDSFNKLANVDRVDFILSGGSAVMEATAPLATQSKMVMFNTGAQSSNMAGISPYVFSVLQLSDFDTGVLSRYAVKELGYKTIATLYVNNDTGTANQASFSKSFEAAGGKIVAQETFKPNETTYGTQVAKIRATKPDAIYIVGTPAELPFAVRQTRQMAPNIPILSYAGLESKEFLDAAGAAANGIIYTTTAYDPNNSAQNVKNFVAAYKAKNNGEIPTSPYSGYGYDAMMIAATALKETKGQTAGDAMAAAIKRIKTFPGVTGENVFRDNGTVAKAVAVRKIDGEHFTTVTVVQP